MKSAKRLIFFLLPVLILVNLSMFYSAGAWGLQWDTKEMEQPPNFKNIASLNGKWLFFTKNGLVVIRDGDVTNTYQLSMNQEGVNNLSDITYANGVYVAVGGKNIMSSTNGVQWTDRVKTSDSVQMAAVAYGNGKFVAVGGSGFNLWTDGTIQTSVDGINWQQVSIGHLTIDSLFNTKFIPSFTKVVFVNGQFVAVGKNAYTYPGIYTSPDGITWTERPTNLNLAGVQLTGITYGNGQYVAVGEQGLVLTSADGNTWVQQASGISDNLTKVVYSDGNYVALGLTGVFFSDNGRTWRFTRFSVAVEDIVAGANGFLLVGDKGIVVAKTDNATQTAQNTVTTKPTKNDTKTENNNQNKKILDWKRGKSIYDSDISHADNDYPTSSMVWGSGKFLIGSSYGNFYESADGINWDKTGHTIAGSWIVDIIYAKGEFMAFTTVWPGGDGTIYTLVSQDGQHWKEKGQINLQQGQLIATASDNIYVIACPDGSIHTSRDGTAWTKQNSGISEGLNSVIWAPKENMFVAVGNKGTIITSKDGMNWQKVNSNVADNLKSVCYSPDDKLFVAVGTEGIILRSNDGKTWPKSISGTTRSISKIIYGNGVYVAIANSVMRGQGEERMEYPDGKCMVLLSSDALNWEQVSYGEDNNPGFGEIMAFGNNTIVAGMMYANVNPNKPQNQTTSQPNTQKQDKTKKQNTATATSTPAPVPPAPVTTTSAQNDTKTKNTAGNKQTTNISVGSAKGDLYFRMLYYYGIGFKPEFFYFLPGNKVYKRIPKGGLEYANIDEAVKAEPVTIGIYRIQNGTMFVDWDNKTTTDYTYERKDGKLYIGGLYANKVKPVNVAQNPEGKWICSDSLTSNSSNKNKAYLSTTKVITLHSNKSFESENIAVAVGEVKDLTYGGSDRDNSSGTYQISGNTLFLNYSDGHRELLTIFLPFGIDEKLGQPEFINIDGDMYHISKIR